jgi:3-deoxy-D-manno-octulosonic acid kinase
MAWSKLHNDRMLIDFESIEGDGSRILVRQGYEAYAPLLTPSGGAVARRVAESLVAGGRQAHPVVRLPIGERILVRHYRRGGLVGRVNQKYYFHGHRAFEELRATARAAAGGVRVPEVIVAAEHRVGLGYTATFATRWIDGATDGAAWLAAAGASERAAFLREAGRQIGLMHAAGVAHPDLNLRNLLIRVPDEGAGQTPGEARSASAAQPVVVYLIDFDRARLTDGPTPPARRARDLRRLGRSARKLGLALEAGDGWLELRAGYGAGWPLADRGYRSSASATFSTT